MMAFLDLLYAPTWWLLTSPPAIGYTLLGVLICMAISAAGIALAKMRFSPLWALAILVPIAGVIGLWILAYKKWPVESAQEHQK